MAKRPRAEEVGVGEAKSHFSALLDRVRDESLVVTITRHGRPVAHLVPLDAWRSTPHVADAAGWLEDDDPFFAGSDRPVATRPRHRRHRPRPGD